jgi:uncharacterized delta-60 repeat protein
MAGALDPSFGIGGLVTTALLGGTHDAGSAVAIQRQTDGKIVVAGTANLANGNSVFAVARYNTNGSLDTTFGTGGAVRTSFGASAANAKAVAITPDGKIVVAGEVNFFNGLAIARYNPDGSLDTTFGGGGEVLTNVGAFDFGGLAVDSSDRVVVAATTFPSTESVGDFTLLRYTSTGGLDGSFGSGGEVVTPSFGPSTTAVAAGVAIQTDGKIVVAGTAETETPQFTFTDNFALARVNADGSLDTGFGSGGEVTTSFGTNQARAAGIAIQASTGAIVVAGSTFGTNFSNEAFALARYNPSNGGLDPSFGTGGEVTTSFGKNQAEGHGIAIDPNNGTIVVTGIISGSTNKGGFTQGLGVARYNASDGSPDKTFGFKGQVTTNFANSLADNAGVAVQNDSKIVVAGTVFSTSPAFRADFALARYNPDGSLDAGFGTEGTVTTNIPGPSLVFTPSLAVDPATGKVVVAAQADIITSTGSPDEVFTVTRYNADGSLDTSFGTGGTAETDFQANFGPSSLSQVAGVAVLPGGKIVLAGEVSLAQGTGFGLVRFNPDGSLDTTFGTGGEVFTNVGPSGLAVPAGLVVDPATGKVVVAGTSVDFSTGFSEDFALVRYNTNGSLDSTFGTGGIVTTNFGNFTAAGSAGVALTPGGQIALAGTFFGVSGNQEVLVARYNTNGSLDSGFGTGGSVFTDFPQSTTPVVAGVAVDPNTSKIVVAGTTQTFSTGFIEDFFVSRYNTNGSLDSAFGSGGIVTTDFGTGNPAIASGVVVQPDSKIVVVGTVENSSIGPSSDEFAVVRYNKNGSLDGSFGTGGVVLTSFGANAPATASAVALAPNGDILVVGIVFDPADASDDIALAAYLGTNGHRR